MYTYTYILTYIHIHRYTHVQIVSCGRLEEHLNCIRDTSEKLMFCGGDVGLGSICIDLCTGDFGPFGWRPCFSKL